MVNLKSAINDGLPPLQSDEGGRAFIFLVINGTLVALQSTNLSNQTHPPLPLI